MTDRKEPLVSLTTRLDPATLEQLKHVASQLTAEAPSWRAPVTIHETIRMILAEGIHKVSELAAEHDPPPDVAPALIDTEPTHFVMGRDDPKAAKWIGEVEISTRTFGTLERAGIHTFGQLTSHTRGSLGLIRGVGVQALAEVDTVLKSLGLAFAETEHHGK